MKTLVYHKRVLRRHVDATAFVFRVHTPKSSNPVPVQGIGSCLGKMSPSPYISAG
jgi:hypothetical protein